MNQISITKILYSDRAKKRYMKLIEDNKIKPDVLWYLPIIGTKWEDAKEMYLNEVGR